MIFCFSNSIFFLFLFLVVPSLINLTVLKKLSKLDSINKGSQATIISTQHLNTAQRAANDHPLLTHRRPRARLDESQGRYKGAPIGVFKV